MFSAYSYKTLKYWGLYYEDIPVKLATNEKIFLKENTKNSSIVQTPYSTFVTVEGIKCRVILNKKRILPKWRIYRRANWEYPNVRYIDNIIVEYTKDSTLLEKLVPYKIKELKILVKKNYGIVKGDMRKRQAWVYAYIDTVLLGFNTFAVRSELNDDILREIYKYL